MSRRTEMKFSRQIPSQPGYFVLDLLCDGAGCPVSVDQANVIAWAFEMDDELSIPYPVTLNGVRTDSPHLLAGSYGVVDAVGVWCAASPGCWLSDARAARRSANGGQQ